MVPDEGYHRANVDQQILLIFHHVSFLKWKQPSVLDTLSPSLSNGLGLD